MIMYIFSEIKYHSNGSQVVAKIKKYAILLSERTWLFLIKKRDTFDFCVLDVSRSNIYCFETSIHKLE